MIVQLCYNLVMEAWLKSIAVRAIVRKCSLVPRLSLLPHNNSTYDL